MINSIFFLIIFFDHDILRTDSETDSVTVLLDADCSLLTMLRQQHMLNEKQVIFNTYLLMTKMQQKKENESEPIRIICLVHDKLAETTKVRNDLVDSTFPSIWLEMAEQTG